MVVDLVDDDHDHAEVKVELKDIGESATSAATVTPASTCLKSAETGASEMKEATDKTSETVERLAASSQVTPAAKSVDSAKSETAESGVKRKGVPGEKTKEKKEKKEKKSKKDEPPTKKTVNIMSFFTAPAPKAAPPSNVATIQAE